MKNQIEKYIFIITLCFLSTPALAIEDTTDVVTTQTEIQEEKTIFTIDQCVDYALNNDPNIVVAKKMIDIYNSKVGQAKSDYFPTIGAGTNYSFNETFIDKKSTPINTYTVDASVNQLIWSFGKTKANIDMQKYNRESAQFDLEYEILKTIYKVKIAYYSVLAAKAYKNVSERTVQINKLNYERTKALFEEGLKSKIDVVNSEVYYTDAQVQLVEANNAYQTALITLANTMYYTENKKFDIVPPDGFEFANFTDKTTTTATIIKPKQIKDDDDELVLTSGIEKNNIVGNFHFEPYNITIENAINMAYENRPDLKSLQLVQKASGESLKAVKRSYFPDLTAGAGYGYGRTSEISTQDFRISAGLEIPVINAMNIKCKIDEAKSYFDIATENINLSKKNIYFEVQNNYISMKDLEEKIPLMAQKISQTLENFELADGRYTVGLGNYIELQEAQTNFNNAQLEFIRTVFKYNVAKEEFLKSMGVR